MCRRELSVATQTRLGGMKEHWRYKSKIPVNPRTTALSSRDPFLDPDTVFPVKKSVPADPFELDPEFEEVDPDILFSHDWHECFAVHMQHPEHITLLEGRGVIASLRHKFRSCSEFGRRHLHFCNNMSMTVLLSKGWSGTYSMLRVCRRVACLLLATDCFLAVRWIPSERNIADGPSRRWEHLRSSDVEGRSTQKAKRETILAACYPSRPERSRDAQAASPGARGSWSQEEESLDDDSSDHGTEESHEIREDRPACGRTKIQGSDTARDVGHVDSGCSGLHPKGARAKTICQKEQIELESKRQLQLGLLQGCEQHVRARLRLPRRHKNHGGHYKCLPRLRPEAHVVANQKGIAGLAQKRTPNDTATNSMASVGRTLHGGDVCPQVGHQLRHSLDVHSLPAARRVVVPAKVRFDSPNAGISLSRPSPTSSSSTTAIEGGAVRRIFCTHHIFLIDLSYDQLVKDWKWALTKVGLASHHAVLYQLCHSGPSYDRQQKSSRGETKRKMELGFQHKALRGTCSNFSRIPSSTPGSAAKVSQVRDGPKTFAPSPEADTPKKKFVLELFSGCARLSRACSKASWSSPMTLAMVLLMTSCSLWFLKS